MSVGRGDRWVACCVGEVVNVVDVGKGGDGDGNKGGGGRVVCLKGHVGKVVAAEFMDACGGGGEWIVSVSEDRTFKGVGVLFVLFDISMYAVL